MNPIACHTGTPQSTCLEEEDTLKMHTLHKFARSCGRDGQCRYNCGSTHVKPPGPIVDNGELFPCPVCPQEEYWQHAYEKQMHYGISTTTLDISSIGLTKEDRPKPEGYPSTFATIPHYLPMIKGQGAHSIPGAATDVMLLGLITKQESTIFDLETRLENAINRGAAGRSEQEIRIEKLESVLKQFIMGSKTKKDTCEECWLCGKSHPWEELCLPTEN